MKIALKLFTIRGIIEVVEYQHCAPPILTEALQNVHLDYGEDPPTMKAMANEGRYVLKIAQE